MVVKRLVTLYVLAVCLLICRAEAEMTAAEAFQYGQTDGSESKRQQVFNNVQGNKASETIKDYSATAPTQSTHYTGNQTLVSPIISGGSAKVSECQTTGAANADPKAAKHCEAVNAIMDTHANKPSDIITPDDPILLAGHAATNDPEAILGNMLGTYGGCTEVTKTSDPKFEYETCEEWSESITTTCKQGLEVTVDPDYLYACIKTLATINSSTCTYGWVIKVDTDYNYQCAVTSGKVNTHVCNAILHVNCVAPPTADGCDTGGLVPETWAGDMTTMFAPLGGGTYGLYFGTFKDNYWKGIRKIFDRILTFRITNKDDITLFSLAEVSFEDWLLLKINGTTIYVGPKGGDRLEVCEKDIAGEGAVEPSISPGVCYSATGFQPGGDLDITWHRYPNIDLRPYLTNGLNTISMRVIVVNQGSGAMLIKARMACQPNCTDVWDNQCEELQARSK